MRLVIDANIIVSALLSPHGAACQVLSDVLDGKYEGACKFPFFMLPCIR